MRGDRSFDPRKDFDDIASPPDADEGDRRDVPPGGQLVKVLLLVLLLSIIILIILGVLNEAQKDGSMRMAVGLGVIAFVISMFTLWKLPKRQVSFAKDLPPEAAFSLENEARKTLAQIIGGIFLLVGIYSTLKTMQISEVAQLAGRLDKAVEQLGSERQQTRILGTSAIVRLSAESRVYEQEARAVFSVHIKEVAPRPDQATAAPVAPSPAPSPGASPAPAPPQRNPDKHRQEIQLMLNYLGNPAGGGSQTDLSNTDLRDLRFSNCVCRGWNFSGALLDRAKFESANLSGAMFHGASLKGLSFEGVNLSGAKFDGEDTDLTGMNFRRAILGGISLNAGASFNRANAQGADFYDADLRGASFEGARVMGANFDAANVRGTNFGGANVEGANFSEAEGLTIEQIERARNFELARLPSSIAAHLRSKYPDRPWPNR